MDVGRWDDPPNLLNSVHTIVSHSDKWRTGGVEDSA